MLRKLRAEIYSHKLIYFLLGVTIVVGMFLRVYRINDLLGFYYDQGRDALEIWDIWHKGEIPFIGPTTGIEGIFRGPFYYYLIAPFYLLGSGDPVWPSVFLSFTTVLAVLVTYYLGYKIASRETGLIAAIISSFSFNIVMASRWLSNPTPMLFLSVLLIWMMLLVVKGNKKAWIGISFIFGLSLFHFGSSGEAFYLLAILIFALWQRKNLPNKKIFIYSLAAFLVSLLPLVAFDIKNKGLLTVNIKNFLFTGESFGVPSWREIGDKIGFLYDVFTNKIFNGRFEKEMFLLAVILFAFVYNLHKLIKNSGVKILLLVVLTGSLGIIFFQGNFGNIYDYYLTGYYLPFILIFSVGLGSLWKRSLGKIFVLYFIYFFVINNAEVLQFKLTDKLDGQQSIALKNQKEAVDWIFSNSGGTKFNVDTYVPPVIPYAYDYLFLWQGTRRCGASLCGLSQEEQVERLYTFYEADPPHPERLEAWLERQRGIGKVEEEESFGGITVQRRRRL